MSNATCWLCSQPILGKRLYAITGWEEERKQGGANQIIKRKRTGRVAHPDCVRHGPSVGLFNQDERISSGD